MTFQHSQHLKTNGLAFIYQSIIIIIIIIIITIIYFSLFTGFSLYFSSSTSCETHHSGFKFLIEALSLLCVMFLVQLFSVENLLNAFLVLFLDFF
jgi:hypothetical protein